MNKKYFNFTICFIILLFLYEIFDHTNLIIQTIYDSTTLWYFNIVPSILPIYIIIDLLLNYKALDYLSYIFGNFMEKVFKLKKETSFIKGVAKKDENLISIIETSALANREIA